MFSKTFPLVKLFSFVLTKAGPFPGFTCRNSIILNNFLDMDKASVPIWAFVALIVVLDVNHKSKKIEA